MRKIGNSNRIKAVPVFEVEAGLSRFENDQTNKPSYAVRGNARIRGVWRSDSRKNCPR